MEARLLHTTIVIASLLSVAASHRTENFFVTASSPQLSREVAEAAEEYRRDLAIEWLGHELARWDDPCPITVNVGRNLGAGGATSFMFEGGRPFGWTMTIQGSRTRILDSVLPHEITHTIFATHFGRPLPRWADEGACTTVEHEVEKAKQKKMLVQFLTTGRGIAFNHMFAMKEYPPDVMPLYAQGYSLARFLIAHGGKRQFVKYVGDGMARNDWTAATKKHYGFENLSELQLEWLDWVRHGYPTVRPRSTMVASNVPPTTGQGGAAETPQAETSLVAASTPKTRLASTGGWYARTRDKTLAARSAANAKAAAPPSAKQGALTTGQSVTRPQSPGRPRQQVIEWTNPPKRSPPIAVVPPAHRPKTRMIGRDVLNRTIWR